MPKLAEKNLSNNIKTIIQCDFDGTITVDDVSFAILDKFADGNWRQWFKDYEDGKISVGRFNEQAFSTVKADLKTLLKTVKKEAKVRPGLRELIDSCRRKNYRFVIVSNGLRFYIDEILKNADIEDIEVFAAETQFHPEGMKVQYIGPDGKPLDNDFKLAYNKLFREQGYRVFYAGNGSSDLTPAKHSKHIFATDTLLKRCKAAGLACTPFDDLSQIAGAIEAL